MSVLPRKFIAAADVEEFESAASAGAGGYVARGAGGQRQTIADRRDDQRLDIWHVNSGARTYGQASTGQ